MDAEGSVFRTLVGQDVARYTIENRVLEVTTRLPEIGVFNRAWLCYSVGEERFFFVSVDQDGQLWVFSGDLDSYVTTSQPKPQADGSIKRLRFTHFNITPDHFEKRMESSTDDGKTWRLTFRQRLVRVAEKAD